MLQDLSDAVTNPGEFKDLDYVKSIPVEETEGFQALFTTVMGSQDGANFLLQHKYVGGDVLACICGCECARACVCLWQHDHAYAVAVCCGTGRATVTVEAVVVGCNVCVWLVWLGLRRCLLIVRWLQLSDRWWA